MNLIPRSYIFDDLFYGLNKPSFYNMKSDIYEVDDNYIIKIDIPGYKKEDINIDIDKGYITVKLNYNSEDEVNDVNYIKRERFFGSTVRQFYVGNVDEDAINASFNNGVLRIEVPKKEEINNKKRIDIQ